MTVSYASSVTTSRGYSIFLRLLFRWKGSVYKLIWADLIIYLVLYYTLNSVYRFALNTAQREMFELVVRYCATNITQVPLSFVLGFYVSLVMSRWWDQFKTIPFPDNMALLISAGFKGTDEHSRLIRRTLARYVCMSFAATMSLISPKAKKRFPTLHHFIDAGLLMPDEKKIMEDLQNEYPNYPRYWLPLAWASNIASRARQDGLLRTDIALNGILQQILEFRTKCGGLLNYDWINIPLVYTQVITIAVYTYFLTSILGRQLINENENLHVPILAVLEFFFYMGWVRVAETLINPFGEDDDDFDVLWLIDRHVQVTYLIVDKIHEDYPKLMQDQYWNSLIPKELPFTVGSEKYKTVYPQSSTDKMNISEMEAEIISPGLNSRESSIKRRDSSLLRKLFGLQRQNADESSFMRTGIPLASVFTEETPLHKGVGKFQISESNLKGDTVDRSPTDEENAGEVIDFDKLKKLRQLLVKQKIIKYMNLMKENTTDEEEKIIDDIITSKKDQ